MALAGLERPRYTHPKGNGSSAAEVLEAVLPRRSWWERTFRWENLTVAGKEVKGFVVSPTIAAVLLAAFLGVLGWGYKSNTADQRETRDSIIRMETMLNERTQTFKEQQAAFKEQLDTEKRIAELQREQANKEMAAMRVALQQKGIRLAE